jgi:hypothetical protein
MFVHLFLLVIGAGFWKKPIKKHQKNGFGCRENCYAYDKIDRMRAR